jgi:hypothetical protein
MLEKYMLYSQVSRDEAVQLVIQLTYIFSLSGYAEDTLTKGVITMNIGFGKSLQLGLYGGIAGGIVFGIMMQMMGKMAMISGMVGSESAAAGWFIHMVISVIFGASFGWLAVVIKNTVAAAVLFGIMIWVAGPLLIMPMIMGMGTNITNAFTGEQLMNLLTHLFFAAVVAATYKVLSPKRTADHISA